jgi:hypothetical protein
MQATLLNHFACLFPRASFNGSGNQPDPAPIRGTTHFIASRLINKRSDGNIFYKAASPSPSSITKKSTAEIENAPRSRPAEPGARILEVWKLRCDERHALDEDRVSRQHTSRVHARTRAIYDVLDQLLAEIRANHCFDETLDVQIGHPTHTVELQLTHAEPLVQQGTAETNLSTETGHQYTRTCFPTVTTTP